MPIPTYVNHGANTTTTTTITPALPADIAVDDILLFYVFTKNTAVTIANQNGGTWTLIDLSGQGTPDVTTACRVTVFWSRYNGTQGSPTTDDPGDVVGGYIAAFRGCKATGDPFNVTSKNTDGVENTSLSATGATTTVADCLVVIVAALMDDTPNFGTWVNADLANITDRLNFSTTLGNDGRMMTVTGEKATAGAYGASTNTLTANSRKAMMTIALAAFEGVTQTRTDPLGLVDSITQAHGLGQTATKTDPLGLLDSGTVQKFLDFDALGLLDSIVVFHEVIVTERTQTDLLGLADSLARVWVGQRDRTDPLGLVDSVIANLESGGAFSRTQVDPLGLLDSIVVSLVAIQSATQTDPLGLTDSIEAVLIEAEEWDDEFTEPLGLTDSVLVTLIVIDPSAWVAPQGVPGTTVTLSGAGTTVDARPEN